MDNADIVHLIYISNLSQVEHGERQDSCMDYWIIMFSVPLMRYVRAIHRMYKTEISVQLAYA